MCLGVAAFPQLVHQAVLVLQVSSGGAEDMLAEVE